MNLRGLAVSMCPIQSRLNFSTAVGQKLKHYAKRAAYSNCFETTERELTERYIAGIAKSIHLERIFQRELLMLPQTLAELQSLVDHQIPLVLVSRCFNGIAESVYDYEGGGVNLAKMRIAFWRGLTGPKARIKLLVGLSAKLKDKEVKQYVSN